MGKPLFKPTQVGVSAEDKLVKLQVGNSVLPMPWHVALRMAARLRVATRGAQEYRGQSRELANVGEGVSASRRAIRENDALEEGGYKVYSAGPDVIVKIGDNATLSMTPEISREVARMLYEVGEAVHRKYFPDLGLTFNVAQLTDGVAVDLEKQRRRSATSAFVPPLG